VSTIETSIMENGRVIWNWL